MIDQRAASRYARALFAMIQDNEELEMVTRHFIQVCEWTQQHPEITNLVSNSTIAQAEKEDFIDKIMPEEISPLLINFLKVLIKKRRFRELETIQLIFQRLYEKKKKIQEVLVVSAVELNPKTLERLDSVLEKKLGLDIRLKTEIDPSIIGGIILRFEGNEIDTSFRSHLLSLSQKLMS